MILLLVDFNDTQVREHTAFILYIKLPTGDPAASRGRVRVHGDQMMFTSYYGALWDRSKGRSWVIINKYFFKKREKRK